MSALAGVLELLEPLVQGVGQWFGRRGRKEWRARRADMAAMAGQLGLRTFDGRRTALHRGFDIGDEWTIWNDFHGPRGGVELSVLDLTTRFRLLGPDIHHGFTCAITTLTRGVPHSTVATVEPQSGASYTLLRRHAELSRMALPPSARTDIELAAARPEVTRLLVQEVLHTVIEDLSPGWGLEIQDHTLLVHAHRPDMFPDQRGRAVFELLPPERLPELVQLLEGARSAIEAWPEGR